jgi:arylsulfatase A-like enzyme
VSKVPRNVLFITADQWRGDCLGAFGHACLRTPVLDALAAEGVAFRRHFSQAAPCGPGRASLYTGLYLHNHRSVNNGTPLDARHSNVALQARRAGYDPVLFGYTDASADPRGRDPGDPELRSYEGVLPGMTPMVVMRGDNLPWLAYLRERGYPVGPEADAVFRPRSDFPGASSRGATWAPALYAAEDSGAAFLTGEVMRYVSVREDESWFVHLSLLSPHPPFVVAEPYHDFYDPAKVPAPVRAPSAAAEGAQHPYLEFYLHHQRDDPYTYGRHPRDNLAIDDAELRQLRATYYGMMSEVDAQLGRLFEFLRARGMYDRTLVVFASDHGEQLGDHWQLSKAGYFDATFHVPLVVRDPERSSDVGRGRIVEAFTENVDVMPTILEWLGVETPAACDGESLLPFCRGETPPSWRDAAHFELDFRNHVDENGERIHGLAAEECGFAVMRGESYKYVHFTALPPLLFDLERDPSELENRVSDPDYAAVRLAQAQRMLSWRMNHDDRVLANTLLTDDGVVQRRPSRR